MEFKQLEINQDMRCKACNRILEDTDDDILCRKCIVASKEVDVYFDTRYKDAYTKNNHEMIVERFLRECEMKELLNDVDLS